MRLLTVCHSAVYILCVSRRSAAFYFDARSPVDGEIEIDVAMRPTNVRFLATKIDDVGSVDCFYFEYAMGPPNKIVRPPTINITIYCG